MQRVVLCAKKNRSRNKTIEIKEQLGVRDSYLENKKS